MKKNKIFKRIISVILSLVLVMGIVPGQETGEVKASTSPEFTLSLESVSGNSWTFGHSELDAAYEGVEAGWQPVRYQFDAYRDGSETPVKTWIEFVGSKAYFWNGNHFADKAAPSSSLVIKKDTVFTEFNVTNGDTGDGEVVATGKTMVLKETFNAVVENGAWVQKTESSQPEGTGPEFTLSLSGVSGKSWTFGHSELDAAYEGVESTWQPMRYQFDAYRDGSETPVKVWIEFVGSKAYFWNGNHFADKEAPSSELMIPKGYNNIGQRKSHTVRRKSSAMWLFLYPI